MTTRCAPPGRTSISQTGFENPLGPHQWVTCRGSVQAWKTNVRGASRTRVRTKSKSSDSTAGLLCGFIWLCLGLEFNQVVIQAI